VAQRKGDEKIWYVLQILVYCTMKKSGNPGRWHHFSLILKSELWRHWNLFCYAYLAYEKISSDTIETLPMYK
jgi:hypothetical protein